MHHYISLGKINKAVISRLENDSLAENFFIKSSSKNTKNNTDCIKLQIKKERSKLERVKAAYEDGIDTIEEYKENKRKLLDEIQRLEKQVEASSSDTERVVDIKNEISEAYEVSINPTIPEEIKNDTLRMLIDKIIYNRSTDTAEIFYKT